MQFLYHDQDLAIVIKPVGLDSESAAPAEIIRELGGECYTVHRLDLNVGGVMVYARTKAAAAALSRLIQEGTLIKEYVALVHGTPEESGDWTDLLLKDARKNKVFVVDRARGGVKKARLTYLRLSDSDPALVRIRLYTGRSHQIRVQFASRKHPLVGDHKYGARDQHNTPMLYSCCLTFPWKGRELRFEQLPAWADAARLTRIADMEAAFDRASAGKASAEVSDGDRQALSSYLNGGQWQHDYEADEAGLIPRCMKRGVLSQDGLYDLVTGWGPGAGMPDAAIIPVLSAELGVRAESLLNGCVAPNPPEGGNMKHIKFYQCPKCGNILTATGRAELSCCGLLLSPMTIQPADEAHRLIISDIETEKLLSWQHPMEKDHHLTFLAAVGYDCVHIVRLYAEGAQEHRLPRIPWAKYYCGCTERPDILFESK